MRFVRFSNLVFLKLLICLFLAGNASAIAQTADESGLKEIVLTAAQQRRPNAVAIGLESLDWQKLTNYGLDEPVDESLKRFAKIAAAAKEIGLDGEWIVLSVEKDGDFSQAQIGQQPNDVISIVPGPDNTGPLELG